MNARGRRKARRAFWGTTVAEAKATGACANVHPGKGALCVRPDGHDGAHTCGNERWLTGGVDLCSAEHRGVLCLCPTFHKGPHRNGRVVWSVDFHESDREFAERRRLKPDVRTDAGRFTPLAWADVSGAPVVATDHLAATVGLTRRPGESDAALRLRAMATIWPR